MCVAKLDFVDDEKLQVTPALVGGQESTAAVWKALHPRYTKVPSTEDWLRISNSFYELWKPPNCLGAIGGKHVRIQKMPKSGSTNYNYEGYNSVVLMATCDDDACFTVIEVGHAGRNSDGGVFEASRINRWLQREGNGLHLPILMLRPYSRKGINNIKRVFNYRLNRGRKSIECAFGMMASKFPVLSTPISSKNVSTANNTIHDLSWQFKHTKKAHTHTHIHSPHTVNGSKQLRPGDQAVCSCEIGFLSDIVVVASVDEQTLEIIPF
ncbi:hypothetical protein PR048_028259 [Dryococelus australis]|uniref:DDE Tnp4 domain-containing protein n=1 Tax=Dryococelus australis TaxID=614101 RepID=A0ABQ9GIR4_9NEOP|nr:hypothetical protein PR048_028259 [Dryococelus australis]